MRAHLTSYPPVYGSSLTNARDNHLPMSQGKTIGPRSLIFGSEVDHSDDLILLQGQGQRSKFRSLPSKIVKTFPVCPKCFHLLLYTMIS